MHPSHDIQGSEDQSLKDRNIAICITGSAAAYKCVDLARKLMRRGGEVRAAMSEDAAELITPKLMHWATGNSVVTELTGAIEHVELAQWADVVVVAPSTANTLSKIAQGVDDTPVTSIVSVAQGLEKPILIVPAMHGSMYSHKIFQDNISRLKEVGVHLLEPRFEEGKAKFPEVDEIVAFVENLVYPKNMLGKKVVVTAGPTVEPVDPVKILTNRSSGKMGIAVSKAAAARGAKVSLIYGSGTEPEPYGVETLRVETTAEMQDAFQKKVREGCDLIVGTAAAQDLMVEPLIDEKLRHSQPVDLHLVPAPRVLDNIGDLAPNAFIVGFKAECNVSDEELIAAAEEKMEENRLDMVVSNDIMRPGAGFKSDTNEVIILSDSGSERLRTSKAEIAHRILDIAVKNI